MGRRNINNISAPENEYLNKWLLRYGKVKVRKYQSIPVLILSAYNQDRSDHGKEYLMNSDEQRLKVITDYIDYVLNIEPRYKRFLKLHQLKGWQFGNMVGYKNGKTWHKSYKRYVYIRALVTMINKHEDLLNKLNNP